MEMWCSAVMVNTPSKAEKKTAFCQASHIVVILSSTLALFTSYVHVDHEYQELGTIERKS
jgi:hypothetical protein